MGVFLDIWRLGQGLGVTMRNFLRRKVTEQYPENRGKHLYFERFRAELVMPHDAENHHKCTACGLCQKACPNGTIQVVVGVDENGKRALDKHCYDVGSCIFCGLCVEACPFGAIEFRNTFEHAVFAREKLRYRLNKEGSSLRR